ncbi:MAG: STAS domain-containing protein [Candidatus Dormibacter sp.]
MLAIRPTPGAPADRCPFRGPFPADFSGCPSYQAVSFTATDSHGQTLGTWLTCRHLASGDYPAQRGQYYPRCTLGTADDRLSWLGQVSLARLEVVRVLYQEFDAFAQPYRQALLQAKARFLDSSTVPGLRRDLEERLAGFRTDIRQFLEERKTRLDEVGLPMERLMAMVEAGCRAWVASRSLSAPNPDETALRALAPEAQAFIAEPMDAPWRRPEPAAESIYEDPILRISRGDSAALRFMGSIDGSNLEAVSQALITNIAGADECHLDVRGLLFCDAGGLRVIAEAAGRLGDGGKLYLDGVPGHLAKITALAGWADRPNLVLLPVESS